MSLVKTNQKMVCKINVVKSMIGPSHRMILIFSFIDLLANLKNLSVIPCETNVETIDVSKALLTPGRLLFPKVAKKSKLDEFLMRRTHLKALEERAHALKKVYIRNFAYYIS